MFNKIILFLSIIYCSYTISQTGRISGVIKDAKTDLPVEDSNIFIENLNTGTTSDKNGKFFFDDLEEATYSITITHISYLDRHIEITVDSTEFINIYLKPNPISLGNVIVTSSKFERTVKETPTPFAIVNKEEIINNPAITPADVIKNEPGISLGRDGIWQTFVSVRGLSRSNLVYLIDGNRIETSTELAAGISLINLDNIKRIEVLKGAASSLYGSGATGGVINLITDDISYNENFKYGVTISNSNRSVNKGSFGGINLYLKNDTWFADLSGSMEYAGNTQTPTGTLPNSQFKTKSISLSSGFKLLPDQEIKVNYQNYDAKDAGLPGGNSLFPSPAKVTYKNAQRILYSAEYNIKNISTSFTGLSLKYFYQEIDRDVENIPNTISSIPAQGNNPPKKVMVQSVTPKGNHKTNGVQLTGNWVIGDNYFLVSGIDFWQRKLFTSREKDVMTQILSEDGNTVVSEVKKITGEKPIPDAYFTSTGIFIQNEISFLNNRMKIDFGGRFDLINIKNDEVKNPLYEITNGIKDESPSNQTIIWNSGKGENTSWSGNIGLLYKLTEELDLTFNFARSFRSPSLEERFEFIDQGNIVKLGNPDLKPEEGYFFDLGNRLWSKRLTVRTNIFLNLFDNLVTETQGEFESRPALIKNNIGKARLFGFELSTEYNLLDEMVFYNTVSYVRGEDTKNNVNLPLIPPLNGRAGLKFPLFNYLNINLNTTFFFRQNNISEGEKETPGYVLLNASIFSNKFRIGEVHFQAAAGVENILDKAYRDHLSTNRGLIDIEPGRNIFLKLRLMWDSE